ncbi:MAG: GNAT family N-acetyltransferase [Pelobium sp.]
MIEIKEAKLSDIPVIHKLANEIWRPTYQHILADEQISFMLDKMYSEKSLKEQFRQHQTFLLLTENELPKGFACYSKTDIDKNYKLEKIYLHPDQQGKGVGKQLITEVERIVKANGATVLTLNVNRGNNARFFYQKMEYQIVQEIDIPYYDFVLNDYIMEKVL